MSPTLSIDGRATAATGSVLEACRAAGIDVPALCHDARVPGSGGHCRACLVEVDGRCVAACTTPARADTRVETATPRLRAYREDLGHLMQAEATPAGQVARRLAEWGVHGERYVARARDPRVDESHPLLRLDLASCIRCRLCEGACAGRQGRFVFAFEARAGATRLGWGGTRFADSPCVACGACAAACPTGAVSDVDRRRAEASGAALRHVRTTCSYCGVGCQLDVQVEGAATIARVDGVSAAAVNHGHLCVKGRYAHTFVHHAERLRTPLVRRGGALVPCSWDEALDTVATGFLRLHGRVAALSSSRCTNEENYLVQKWMRAGLGSHHVDCCARVCHAPSARGMRQSLGTGAATNSFADIERADLHLVAGSNSTEAHPIVGARILQAVRHGARLIVIDPRRTELAELADVHLAPRPGTNVALLNAMAQVIVAEDLVAHAYVDAHTDGWANFRAHVGAYTPERTASVTGVAAGDVRRAARLYAAAERPMQTHGLGITEHYQGSEAVMLLCNLALLVGAIGREGVGVNPLRGQNNVQGAADMGCQPDLLTGYQDARDPDVQARFEAAWGRPLPTEPGLTIPRLYDAMLQGRIAGLFVLGEDVAQSDPGRHVDAALASLDLLVVQELFLSETARRAHVVLPGASAFEKDGTFTSGERRIQRVRQAVPVLEGARPDWQILCELMTRTGLPQRFAHPAAIFDEIASLAPLFAGVSYARLDGDGLQWPVPTPDHPGTPILHTHGFARGRAQLACVDHVPSPTLRDVDRETYPLLLTTGRVLEHYNCGSMTRRSGSALLHPRDELELAPADAIALRIVDGTEVVVRSPWGEAHAVARSAARIAPGTAFLSFHFPETHTNQLLGPVLDRLSDCPEYKAIPVGVSRA